MLVVGKMSPQLGCQRDEFQRGIDDGSRYSLFRKMLISTVRCIARREALLFEVEKEGEACSRRFLSETRTGVREEDVACLLRLLDQVCAHEKFLLVSTNAWDERFVFTSFCSKRGQIGARPSAVLDRPITCVLVVSP